MLQVYTTLACTLHAWQTASAQTIAVRAREALANDSVAQAKGKKLMAQFQMRVKTLTAGARIGAARAAQVEKMIGAARAAQVEKMIVEQATAVNRVADRQRPDMLEIGDAKIYASFNTGVYDRLLASNFALGPTALEPPGSKSAVTSTDCREKNFCSQLRPSDVVLINTGLHDSPHQHRSRLCSILTAYRRRVRASGAPHVIFVQTHPQHFEFTAAGGTYAKDVQTNFSGCVASVDQSKVRFAHDKRVGVFGGSVYRENEESLLGGSMPVLPLYTALSNIGTAKVGTAIKRKAEVEDNDSGQQIGDCTHWCMPGPLDEFVLPALQALLQRLVATESSYSDVPAEEPDRGECVNAWTPSGAMTPDGSAPSVGSRGSRHGGRLEAPRKGAPDQ